MLHNKNRFVSTFSTEFSGKKVIKLILSSRLIQNILQGQFEKMLMTQDIWFLVAKFSIAVPDPTSDVIRHQHHHNYNYVTFIQSCQLGAKRPL